MTPEMIKKQVDELIDREGGFVDHPLDVGGATKFGITLRAFKSWQSAASLWDLKNLTRPYAQGFYQVKYVNHRWLNLGEFKDPDLFRIVLDSAVLFSRRRAARWLQMAINADEETKPKIKVDGRLGKQSFLSLDDYRERHFGGGELCRFILRERVLRHARRVQERPDQAVFLVGWLDRALKVGT